MGVFGDLAAEIFDFQTLKILHVFGVVIFLGNIIVTGWWKVMADRTGNPAIIAFAQRQVTLTDWVFTASGVLIVLVAGFGMVAHMGAEILQQTWLVWGLGLFVASGVVWAAILVPVQIVQARMARRFSAGEDVPARYWVLGRIWLIFGILATLLPLANLYWMVAKTS